MNDIVLENLSELSPDDELRPLIDNGIRYLNETFPNWWNQIDVDYLCMNDGRRCILGQLHPGKGWTEIVDDLGLSDNDIVAYGLDYFFSTPGVIPTEPWKRVIINLRKLEEEND